MAKSAKERLEEIKKQRAEGSSTSTSSKKTGNSASDRLAVLKSGRSAGLDTFDDDLASANSLINDVYSGWRDSATMTSSKQTVQDMYGRLGAYKQYMNLTGEGDMTQFNTNIDDIMNAYSSALGGWDNRAEAYGYYQNADAFNKAMKKNDLETQFKGLSYSKVQELLNQYEKGSDEYNYLSSYTGYTSNEDFQNALRDLVTRGGTIYSGQGKALKDAQSKFLQENPFSKYEHLAQNEDYEANKSYVKDENANWFSDSTHKFIGEDYENDMGFFTQSTSEKAEELRNRLFGTKNTQYLEENERDMYNYIYNTSGKEEADKYLADMEVVLAKRANGELTGTVADITNSGGVATKTLGSALSVPWNVVGGATSFLDDASRSLYGLERNPYGTAHTLSNVSETIRDTTREGMGNVGAFLYDTGLSIGESAINALAFGNIGSVMMGMNAAQSTAKEMYENGATEEQIRLTAGLSGVWEWLGEHTAIDQLLSIKSTTGVKSFVKNVLKQSGQEASEEMFTELANIVTDIIVNGDESEYHSKLQEYMDRGFSEKEASRKAFVDMGINVALAGVGGALSGSVMGGVATATDYSKNKSTGQQIVDMGNTDRFQALTNSVGTDKYNDINQKIADGTAKPAEIGAAYREIGASGVNESDYRYVMEQRTIDNKSKKDIVLNGMTVKDGETVLKTSEGDRKLSDVTLSSREAMVVAFAETMDEARGNAFIQNYDGRSDISAYKKTFDQVYSYGKDSMGIVNAMEVRGNLSTEQAMEIFKLGEAEAVANKLSAINEKRTNSVGITPGTFNDSAVDYSRLTSVQKKKVAFLKAMSDFTGMNIELIQTYEKEDGSRSENYNGAYDPDTNTVYVDVYAGFSKGITKDAIVSTFAHETTHWMRYKSPEAYANLSNIVLDAVAKTKKTDVETLVGREMKTRGLSKDNAIDEIVARACEDMVNHSEVMKDYLSKMDEKSAKTFVEKLQELIENIREWIADVLSIYDDVHEEARLLRDYAETLDEMSQAWDKALLEAIETNKTMQSITEDSTAEETNEVLNENHTRTLYSTRENLVGVDGNLYPVVVELNEKDFRKATKNSKEFAKYIYDNLLNQKIEVLDKDGNLEVIEFAKKKETVKKDGSKNPHPVVGKLTQEKDNDKKLVIINLPEVIKNSGYIDENPEQSHQWLDENGWEIRRCFVVKKRQNVVYPVILSIGRTRDGRNVLYSANIKKNEGVAIDKNATSEFAKKQTQQAVEIATPSNKKIVAQKTDGVKLYSDRDTAPTFYSHMGRVIDGIKNEKIGASSVVSYLKGKGVKDEEIKWSGIEQFLDGKKSVTKAELQEFAQGSMLQIEEEVLGGNVDRIEIWNDGDELEVIRDGKVCDTLEREESSWNYLSEATGTYFRGIEAVYEYYGIDPEKQARWKQYELWGGENYREYLFKLPNSEYSNDSMGNHWGRKTTGVLAHARVQDMETRDGEKMLFIEEIQSDWHNAGQTRGYGSKESISRSVEKRNELEDKLEASVIELADQIKNEDFSVYPARMFIRNHLREDETEWKKDADHMRKNRGDIAEAYGFDVDYYIKTVDKLRIQASTLDELDAEVKKVPDAPFKNGKYIEYVLKSLIRKAAEENYDAIGWTTADIQSKRWSDEYAEGYRIEYDQDIPKFLRKYGKKWGAEVGKTNTVEGDTVWYMNITDSMKDSVIHEGQVMYSDRDNQGNTLTAEQIEFFKDSKVRDENGNLKVMYHGTENGGFHEFISRFSDDDRSFFFTDSSSVAKGYSGISYDYAAKTLRTDADVNKLFAEIGVSESYQVEMEDGHFVLYEDGEEIATSDTAKDIYEEFRDWTGNGYGSANYKVYLNVKNPLIIDAENNNWDELPSMEGKEDYDYIKILSSDGRLSTIEYLRNGETSPVVETVDLYKRFSEGLADRLSDAEFGKSIRNVSNKTMTTREYAEYAQKNGYDGVIFNNIVDTGLYSSGANRFSASTVVVAFKSDQIKSVANTNPTSDPDIRYSDRDSEGNTLTTEQMEFFKDSKVRDKNGNLKVVYHGTNETFSVFKPNEFLTEKNGHSNIVGYFSENEEYSKAYGETKPYYLSIKNPLRFEDTQMTLPNWKKWFKSMGVNGVIFDSSVTGKNGTRDTLKGANFDGVMYYSMIDLFDSANYWTGDGNLTERVKAAGYDGMVWDEEGLAWMPFSPEQVKSVDNTNPTSDLDIRYSDRENLPSVIGEDGNVTVHGGADYHTIEEAFYRYNKDVELDELAEKVFKAFNITQEYNKKVLGYNYPVRFLDSKRYDRDSIGMFVPVRSGFTANLYGISYNVDRLNALGEQERASVLLHEVIHALTTNAIRSANDLSARTIDLVSDYLAGHSNERAKAGAILIDVYQQIKRDGRDKYYGCKDEYEMVAELSNPEFRNYLKKRSLWARIVDAIKKIIGIKQTAFDAVSSAFEKILDDVYEGEGKRLDAMGIRYSDRETESVYDLLGKTDDLEEKNRILIEEVERLNERLELERTVNNVNELDFNKVNTVAKHLLNISRSNMSTNSLVEELKDLYSYIIRGEDVEMDTMRNKAFGIAREMLRDVKEVKVKNDYFKMVLRDIRKTKISLDADQIQEATNKLGPDYREKLFGKITLSKSGIRLAEQWKEWSTQYPEIFDASLTGGDQIAALIDKYYELKEGSEVLQKYNSEEDAFNLALEIINQYYNVSTIRTTVDEYEKRIKQLNYEHRMMMKKLRDHALAMEGEEVTVNKAMYQDILQKLKEKKVHDAQETRKRNREYLDKYKAENTRRETVDSITKKSLKLLSWLEKNSSKEHVPEALKPAIKHILLSIDFSSKRYLGMTNGKHKGEPTKTDLSLREAFENLANSVESVDKAQIQDGEFDMYADFPPEFATYIREVSTAVNKYAMAVGDNEYILNKMTQEELDGLDALITALTNIVTKTNKRLADVNGKTISNAAQNSMVYMNKLGKHWKRTGSTTDFFNFSNGLPMYVFKRFGEGGREIFKALQDGWDKLAFNVHTVIKYAEEVYTAKEVKEWSKDVREFDIQNGDEAYHVQMTIPQIMSLYCLQKRDQAKSHLAGGGMRVADFEVKKGVTISQPEGTTLRESDIRNIISELSPRQIEVADKLQRFMNGVCSDWGNEISMRRFGIMQFGEENYFPIYSDGNNLNSEPNEGENSLYRLLNLSFTKGTIRNANNRIVVENIFDVFANHSSDMAKYNALALPVLDAVKWYNYKEKELLRPEDEKDKRFKTYSVKQSMESAYGNGAKNYVKQFLQDLNGANSGGVDVGEKGARHWISKYKIASVGSNLRVALLQPSAFVRASVVIDPKYLAMAFTKRPQHNKARETCGIALWKSMGFRDTNIARGVVDQIKHADKVKDKITEASMKLAELGDTFTWGYLYNACEAEVRAKRPELKGKEFEKAVADRLRDVIYASQTVDSTLTKTQFMRSTTTMSQILTAFMSEPMVSYNMLYDCYESWNEDRRQSDVSTAFKKNGKKIARASMAYIMTTLASALMGAIPDWVRDDDEEKDFQTFIEMIGENAVSDALGMIPLVKDAVSVAQGYSPTRMDQQYIVSTFDAYRKIVKLIQDGECNYKTVYSVGKAISQLTGIPFSNLMRDVVAIWNDTIGRIYPSLKWK